MNKKKNSLMLLVVWMIFIFIMSSFNANESSNQSGFIVSIISNLFNINNIDLLTFIIRKLAHFIEYLILGMLSYNFIKNYNINISISVIICIIYAISDEIHQLFVVGRSCELRDILVDVLGSLVGIFILNKLIKKSIFEK